MSTSAETLARTNVETRSPTARIASIVAGVTSSSLDAQAIAAAKVFISDGIAVAVAGSTEDAPRIVAAHVKDAGCREDASVWSFGFRTSPALAAYANAVSMHVLDFEPMSSPPTHAVSPTLPVALALGEVRKASGREIVTACAKGFEMQGRVLLASSHERGSLPFHTPGVVGVMGSAVAASHLLGLEPVQIQHALGIAASRCAGLSANTGSMVKCTHCGNVAQAGLEAAMLAKRGFIANPGIFEAKAGYVETFFPKHFDYEALFQFARPFRFVDPGMAIKFYPSKYPTHFGIAAAIAVRKRVIDTRAIARIHIDIPDITDADRPKPRSGLEGKFSFQYTVTAALLDGRVGIETFTDERRFAADMVELLDKIELTRDSTRSRDTRNMRVAVTVMMRDGTTFSETCERPPGSWGAPIDHESHRAKVRSCLAVRLSEAQTATALELLDKLDELAPEDVARLMTLLRGPERATL
ncbi:MAG: MmgE/PrpD family protein [Burkholderiales bacterium]